MGSGLPRHVHAGAHDWGQVLTFQGKSCSLFGSFTTWKGEKETASIKEEYAQRTLQAHSLMSAVSIKDQLVNCTTGPKGSKS